MDMWKEKRTVERHIIELPIKYKALVGAKPHLAETKNMSQSGLLFLTTDHFDPGVILELTLPTRDRVFTVTGKVVYSKRELETNEYRTGVQFLNPESIFIVKMAEQLHQIDQYRKRLTEQAGHPVSEQEAAERWIQDHSMEFAKFYGS